MTIADENKEYEGGDEIVAAEYVLGVLPAEERAVAAGRVETERTFARQVDAWEARLAPLSIAYLEIEPPMSVKAALDRRLFGSTMTANVTSTSTQPIGLWTNLAFWRGLTLASVAALVATIAVPRLVELPPAGPQPQYVASLASDASPVRYLIVYDPREGEVRLSHVAGERESGHDFELWMIGSDKRPVSMGVIPVGSAAHLVITDALRKALASGAVLAVSVEPSGGSPTGQPTGPVVATGDLRGV